MALAISKEEYRLGAIYSAGMKRPMARERAEALLVRHTGLSPAKAKQLVAHWWGSGPWRDARLSANPNT